MRKYAVAVVTYNRKGLLEECIDHILNQVYKVAAVIIVDNNSNDGTREYLKKLSQVMSDNEINFRVLLNDSNKGGAGGYEAAVKDAVRLQGIDYVTLIDDDAMLDAMYIKCIDEEIERNPEISAYSGSVYVDGAIDTSHRRRVKSRLLADFYDVPIKEYVERDTFEYELTSFCGVTISMSLIKKIGLPLGAYFIRYDDTEYSFRINKYSKIINVNSALLIHKVGVKNSGNKRPIDIKLYYDVRNRIDMCRRHCGKASVMLLYIRAYMQCAASFVMEHLSVQKEKKMMYMKKKQYYCMALHDAFCHVSGKGAV